MLRYKRKCRTGLCRRSLPLFAAPRLPAPPGLLRSKLFIVEDDTDDPLERLHRLIIKDVKIIARKIVDEIKTTESKPRKKK
jgi:hypothetical protein